MTCFTQLVKQNSFWFCVEMKNRKTVDNKHFRILAVLAFNLPYIQCIATKSPMINEPISIYEISWLNLCKIHSQNCTFIQVFWAILQIRCCFARLCRCHPKVNDANDKCIYFVRISGTFYLKFVQSNWRMRKHWRRYRLIFQNCRELRR